MDYMESALAYLLEHYPLIGITLLLFFLTIYVTIRVYKYKLGVDSTKNKVDSLPCAEREKDHAFLKEKILSNENATLKSIEDLRKLILSRENNIEELVAWVMKKDNKMINILTKKHSPLSMTAVGKILFELTPTMQLVDDNKGYFLSEIEKENPPTAFDVENTAFKVMLRNINQPMFNGLKQYLFNAPEKIPVKDPDTNEEELIAFDMNTAMQLMSIYLRDLYMDIHPDIK
jgi:hypothetical protein